MTLTLPQNIAAICLCILLVWLTMFYVVPPVLLWLWRWINRPGKNKRPGILLVLLCVFTSLRLMAGEAVLNIQPRTNGIVVWISGGETNVQYQIWTAPNPDQNVAATNWYYWRHAYSATFHPYAEILVYGENTSKQPQRFFQIRGVLAELKQR